MARYIDADALKPDYIVGSTSTNTECYRYVSLSQIESAPTADVPDRKVGKWINTGSGEECSKCHEIQYGYDSFRRYCPNCGAEMGERSEDVVEVVRCKYCAHHEDIPYTTNVWCEKVERLLSEDWFCADGERREDVVF